MALSETYVDPSIAADSGSGTIGSPYGDLQYALNTMTRDSTNGDRINIKAGTDEVLSADLSLTTYGTPGITAPLVFQGYTSSAGDGGIGGVDGNNAYRLVNGTSYFNFIDLHLHNGATGIPMLRIGAFSYIINCEVNDNGNSNGGIWLTSNGALAINCHVHDCARGITCGQNGTAAIGNYVENDGARTMDYGIVTNTDMNDIYNNIINVDSTTTGILCTDINSKIYHNTVYSNGGTGTGIELVNLEAGVIFNNYVEGFSGTGGEGISIDSGSNVIWYQSNRWYNNTTNETLSGNVVNDNDNSAVASSALTNPSSGDFSVGTDLKAGAWPSSFKGSSTNQYLDIGAAQREEPAGSGGGGGRQGLHSIEAGAV